MRLSTSFLFVLVCLMGLPSLLPAQLEVSQSLLIQSEYKQLCKRLRVQRIVGTVTQDDSTRRLGEKRFNEKGQCIEDQMSGGNTCKYGYHANGRLSEKVTFPRNSLAFSERITYDFDSSETRFRETSIRYLYGGAVPDTTRNEFVILANKPGLIKKKQVYSGRSGYTGYSLSIDSTASDGDYRIREVYYLVQMTGEVYHTLSMTRKCTLNKVVYWDEIESEWQKDKQVFTNCFTKYEVLDEKGRVVEQGVMRYGNKPEEQVPEELVREVLAGHKRDAKYRVYDDWVTYSVYDRQGYTKDKEWFKTGTTLVYNAQKQLIEIVYHGESKSKSRMVYAANGLLVTYRLFEWKEAALKLVYTQQFQYTYF